MHKLKIKEENLLFAVLASQWWKGSLPFLFCNIVYPSFSIAMLIILFEYFILQILFPLSIIYHNFFSIASEFFSIYTPNHLNPPIHSLYKK